METSNAGVKNMDAELRLWRMLSLRLPKMRGSGALSNMMKRVWLRKSRAPQVVDVLGSNMELLPSEFIDGQLLFHPHLYDWHEMDFIRRHLRPGDTFLDAGAHVGFYALFAARCVAPTGTVVAIEADPETVERLQRHVALNDVASLVKPLHIGLSDQFGILRLGRDLIGNRGRNSFLFERDSQIEIECKPLLQIMDEQNVQSLSGAKFDLEGLEFRVLRQFLSESPRTRWPKFVIVEYYPDWTDKAGGNVLELLQQSGYIVHWESRRSANRILVLRE